MLTLEKFEEASERLNRVLLETKLVYSDYFSEQTGAKVYFKPENMQFTGAYKLRGAYYKISTLTPEERERGIISASAGNHAQGVAYAAKLMGAKAVIVMPTTTPLIKVNRTKGYGAEVILHGDVYDDACACALELAEEKGYTFIHPFNDETVATGQGTIAMEIIKELPTVDYILVPIGGGGLCCGVSTLAKMLNPKIKVIGVEPAGAACMKASLAAGHVVTLPKVTTIADGTAVKTPGDVVFPYIQKNVDDIITVEDDDLIAAFLDMMENHKMIVENSGLLTVAALKQLNIKGKKVVSILSGGNMDVITIASVVQNGLIQRDRIFTVSVLLPDKPGELHRVAGILAELRGNVIKLEHNQFVSVNRSNVVELLITLEAFGTEHKERILKELENQGYRPLLKIPKQIY
ncbi:threonine ammonia-lyase [Frisingicoccus caecimuris]|uniref:L-threonine dehydratase catabolic TdcB n=1 Tax=Frisingicoccus caecimuris TaxID=1796636 RepID=A0A4R2LQ77_9FIRM|nr:threonine ammonia-lyase [Frisingicoccus caecimuris]MCR1918595.1 threonine ammonia-lyase [Frisingicoccus caecimuris]TCO86226.1 threonine dehydratase [Frisingicoccus caecimuris]